MVIKGIVRFAAVAALLLPTTGLSDTLEVLADRGGVAVEVLIGDIIGMDRQDILGVMEERRQAILDGEQTKEAILKKLQAPYPIHSRLEETKITSFDFAQPNEHVTQPIAFIGNGFRSKRWLAKHGNRLIDMNTFVVMINVKDESERLEMSRILGREIVALSLDGFAIQHGVKGLPALMTENGVYQ